MTPDDLVEKTKEVLANTFVLYMKAHSYHWNVIGSDFPQLHKFFGKLYEELHDAVDVLAEQLRQLDSFAPATLSRMVELSTIEEDEKIPTAANMVNNLITANEKVIDSIKDCYKMAEQLEMYAHSNILQDRLSAHVKHNWMLKATAGKKS
jgi:starvation-inducible DNA-binding protein